MTVDSEAIFALAEMSGGKAKVLEKLCGSMASAWLDERAPEALFCARGVGRPLWIGEGKHGTFFASTCLALEVVEHYTGVALAKGEVREGTVVPLEELVVVEDDPVVDPDDRAVPDRMVVGSDRRVALRVVAHVHEQLVGAVRHRDALEEQ